MVVYEIYIMFGHLANSMVELQKNVNKIVVQIALKSLNKRTNIVVKLATLAKTFNYLSTHTQKLKARARAPSSKKFIQYAIMQHINIINN